MHFQIQTISIPFSKMLFKYSLIIVSRHFYQETRQLCVENESVDELNHVILFFFRAFPL
jgi:hypothetical protein